MIVMLTALEENQKKKADQYWPEENKTLVISDSIILGKLCCHVKYSKVLLFVTSILFYFFFQEEATKLFSEHVSSSYPGTYYQRSGVTSLTSETDD